ncbi:MAG: hypothetical protein KAT65_09990 [Methanophagales archaeon]|nr:hypothetical protein [Methanophagales archaeon]
MQTETKLSVIDVISIYISCTFISSSRNYTGRHGVQNVKSSNKIILILGAVQQSKIGRKRKANRALNPKRSKIFGAKSNCGTATLMKKWTKIGAVVGGIWRCSISLKLAKEGEFKVNAILKGFAHDKN